MINAILIRANKLIVNFIKSLVRLFCKVLPSVIQFEILRNLSRQFRIESAEVSGDLGSIIGSPVDLVWGSYAREKNWAPEIYRFLSNTVFTERVGTFFDIGANIGLTTIPIANLGSIQCYCFEPDPKNFEFLSKNIRRNSPDQKVILNNFALFSRNGEIEFELSCDNLGDHRIRPPGSKISSRMNEDMRRVIKTKIQTLDSLYSNNDFVRPFVVKMDAQGSEADIFKGGEILFSRVDYVIAEFSPYHLLRLGATISEFFDGMLKFPYSGVFDDSIEYGFSILPTETIIEQISADKHFIEGRLLSKHVNLILSSNKIFL